MDDVEKVREKADIVEFIGKFTKLTATGKNFKGVCPIHNEKTASFLFGRIVVFGIVLVAKKVGISLIF